MTDAAPKLILIYDGQCPLCSYVAKAARLREAVGQPLLIDARQTDHPQIVEVMARGFDLNRGFVLCYEGHYYHGVAASHLLACLTTRIGLFNRVNAALFRHRFLARLLYPLMKGIRSLLLFIRGTEEIQQHSEMPIFQNVFGEHWASLHPVMQAHYINRPFSDDVTIVKGAMDIEYNWWFACLTPFCRLTGTLVPYRGTNIPVTVLYRSEAGNTHFNFERQFYFTPDKPFIFRSQMRVLHDNVVVEFMRFGMGWRMLYEVEGENIRLRHQGYIWRVFGLNIRLPLELIIGVCDTLEVPISQDTFKMHMALNHRLFGKIYEYRGTFHLVSPPS